MQAKMEGTDASPIVLVVVLVLVLGFSIQPRRGALLVLPIRVPQIRPLPAFSFSLEDENDDDDEDDWTGAE
jgi:hypothetical protein